MQEPIEITFEINPPKTITDSVINTLILSISDYKQVIAMGRPLEDYEGYKNTVNKIVDTIKQEVNNLYI